MDLLYALAFILGALILAIVAMLVMAKKKTKVAKANAETVEKAEANEQDEDVVVKELQSTENKGYEAPHTAGSLRAVEII